RLMVAAAGNEHEVGGSRPAACYPAAEMETVGVGALRKDDLIADYSNAADSPESDGFYTFGGGAPAQPLDNLLRSPAPPSTDTIRGGGIIGLYLADFPDGKTVGARDTNGWAEWAGTSFATPIISGIAASLIAGGDRTPLKTMRTHCKPAPDDVNNVYLYVKQG